MDDYGEDVGWDEAALSPSDERRDNEVIIQECMQNFAAKDFIMEPDIFNNIRRYYHAGGIPEEMVTLLSENYSGIAQSTNLLANWLIVTGAKVPDVEQMVENHLETLIIKHFDPKKADSIFSAEGETPSWLEDMIVHQTWRSMFYKLAEQHPDCLMLNFTIKLISDAGYQGEITSVSTACQQIEVFSRVLKTSACSFLEEGEQTFENNLPEFSKKVCYGQHTYLYAQCLLNHIAQNTDGGNKLIRISQELQKTAVESGHEVTEITLSLNGASAYPRAYSALSSMLGKNSLNPGDITVLYKLFSSSQPPPCALIRVPQFLELLLEALFKPGQHLNPEHKYKYVYLLAYAASVHETWIENERATLNRDELKTTSQALDKIHSLCVQETKKGSQLLAEVGVLFHCIRFPVVAMGLLKWVDCTVSDPSFFKLLTDSTPVHLALLDEISSCHVLQHRLVLNVLIRLFESPTPLDTLVELEFKKTVLDRMIHLLSRGYVVAVISYINSCLEKQNTDNSLIRHFVTEVLEMIAPPYSPEFIQLFLPIVRNEEITGRLRSADRTDDVSLFLAHCAQQAGV
ncbi:negative elongation factor D-like [Porites lutea]|uniref:negative elongation factor D-like n=1 Tax=Porites lutea TaxID=51062 RepID=UPI003CC64958